MKVKIDENLPVEIAAVLRRAGVDAHTTLEEGLRG
jgi:predicted nuclease of predicted toxin-antitoxin system